MSRLKTATSSSSEEIDGLYEFTAFMIIIVFLITILLQISIKMIPYLHVIAESIVSLIVGLITGLIMLGVYYLDIDFFI
ncbi:hypothetical protein QTN25_005004 [Entamoeba marina]